MFELSLSKLLSHVWVVLIACLGGVVRYMQGVRNGTESFSWMAFIIEIITSGFVGILTYHICLASELGTNYSIVLVGITGHMGAEAIRIIRNHMPTKFGLRKD